MYRWTQARKDRVATLWIVDGLSAAQIAGVLCEEGRTVTRNAVIGIVSRMGLSAAHKPVPPPPPPRTAAQRVHDNGVRERIRAKRKRDTKPPPVQRIEPTPEPEEPASLNLSIFDLDSRTCKWPHGEPGKPGFAFCGHATAGDTYCPYHRGKAYSRGTSRDFDRIAKRCLGRAGLQLDRAAVLAS